MTWSWGSWSSLVGKSVALIIADQFLRAGSGHLLSGLDFLAFIGISMVVVGSLCMLRRPEPVILALLVTLLGLRFASPAIFGREQLQDLPSLVQWVFGVHGVAGISYPLSPWLVYPLLGFLAGRAINEARGAAAVTRFTTVCFLVSLIPSAYVLTSPALIIFRWGTVSIGFLVLSLSVLAGCAALALWIGHMQARRARFAVALGVSGLASFVIVPVHYAVIDALRWAQLESWVASNFTVALAMILVFVLVFSNAVSRGIQRAVSGSSWAVWACGVIAGAAYFSIMLEPVRLGVWALPALSLIGPLAICGLLAARQQRRVGGASNPARRALS